MTHQIVQRSAAPTALSGLFTDSERATTVLEEAARRYHLVSPTSAVQIPEGCALSVSLVLLDAEKDTYPIAGDDEGGGGGKRGLSKNALDRIAAAAGISWDVRASGRTDDGSDPRYVCFRAVGHIRDLDGVPRVISATKELDLRPGSPTIVTLETRYRNKRAKWERDGRRGYEPKPPDGQIRELLAHKLSHCESKARNRAIRSIGIKTSYDRSELTRPFAIAKLAFTGESEDPELRRQFAMKRADSMLAGMASLYGGAPASSALPPRLPPPELLAPCEPDDEEDGSEVELPPAATATVAPEQADDGVQRIPGGDERGTPLAKASTSALSYWERRVAVDIEMKSVRDESRAKAWLDAARAELAGRGETGGDAR